MNDWTEYQIGLVYYSGIFISVVLTLVSLIYLHPIKPVFKLITKKMGRFLDGSFRTTVVLAGILGAFSVSFRSCSGSYQNLLESKQETLIKGMEQITASITYLWMILIFWLVFFILLALFTKTKLSKPTD